MKRFSSMLMLVLSTAVLLASCGGGATGGGGGFVPGASGTLDTTFNTTGVVSTPICTFDDEAYAVAIQSDGKIVAAGYSYIGSQNVFALVRYNTNGSLDTTFNATGIVTTAAGQALAVAIQPDGKIVAAGTSNVFALVRYNTDGSLDTTFNTTGIVTTAVGTSLEYCDAVAIQPDGKIVAAGTSYSNGGQEFFALVRYNTDGSLDTTFNTTGIVTTTLGTNYADAFAVAIQSDGKIVAAGISINGNGSQYFFTLVRYNTDGSLDTTFNTTGIVTTAIGASYGAAFGVAIQSDGKIIAVGYYFNSSQQEVMALVRYNTNGSLDTTFNTTGIVTTSLGGPHEYGDAVAIQSDGKIVAAGTSYNGSQNVFVLARFMP
jgi:uncharacterized delta-60 repeat protein